MNQKSFQRINIFRNEDDKYYQVPLEEEINFDKFLHICSQRLNIKAKKVFDSNLKEIKDIKVVRIIKNVIVTEGEEPIKNQFHFLKKSIVNTVTDFYNTNQLSLPVTSDNQEIEKISVVVMGNSTVGKSSITLRYINNVFPESHESTIYKYSKREIVDGQLFDIELFDTAGEEDYKGLRNIWMKQKDAVIFIYAIDDKLSFSEIQNLHFELLQLYDENKMPQIALVGNKCDQEHNRKVETRQGKMLAEKLGAMFLECSAKTNQNIKNLFINIISNVKIPRDLQKLQDQNKSKAKGNRPQDKKESQDDEGCKFCDIY